MAEDIQILEILGIVVNILLASTIKLMIARTKNINNDIVRNKLEARSSRRNLIQWKMFPTSVIDFSIIEVSHCSGSLTPYSYKEHNNDRKISTFFR